MYSIMIVDDEKAIRENLSKAVPFEDYGFYVCGTAANGAEALEMLPIMEPDLIMLDVCMPVMDGLGFLKELRNSERRDTMVIMLSGFSDFEYAKAAMRYGVKGYLTKPVDDEVFPLLSEIQNELSENKRKKTRGTIREDIDLLNGLYHGKSGNRKLFQEYTLLHCTVLSMNASYEEEDRYKVLQECMESQLEEQANCLFRSRGSLFTYLIPKDVMKAHQNSNTLFAKHLLYLLKKENLECVLMFDSTIFEKEEGTFRQDYSEHLYRMLTEVFFGRRGVIEYEGDICYNNHIRLHAEDCFLDSLKKNLQELNKEAIEREFQVLTDEIEKIHLEMEYLQEINYRIYYLLIDIMSSVNNAKSEEAILPPPEWRDYPFFLTFEKWKDMQKTQIMEVYSFMERCRKMACIGVCGEIIEYVHRHYSEPITVKEIADIFFINAAYLGRAFQKATGTCFKQYVNDLRIAEAKRMLTQTDMLIYEIANIVGYAESKYFIEKFKDEVGICPSEYRKR